MIREKLLLLKWSILEKLKFSHKVKFVFTDGTIMDVKMIGTLKENLSRIIFE